MPKHKPADNLPLPPMPSGKFAKVMIDPPWHFEQRSAVKDEKTSRNPQRHYPTMDIDAICAMPIADLLEKDALVAMWITGPMIVRGVHARIFDAWGIQPSAVGFVWIKTRRKFDINTLARSPLMEADLFCSTAYTTLQNAEYCLFARRGSLPRACKNVRQVIIEAPREHSRKPEAAYKRLEVYAHGRQLDVFGGRPRPGWEYWGYPHWEGNAENGE